MLFDMEPTKYTFTGTYNGKSVHVEYGSDPVIGYWIDVFDPDPDYPNWCILEESSVDTNLYEDECLKLLKELGCTNEKHLELVRQGVGF